PPGARDLAVEHLCKPLRFEQRVFVDLVRGAVRRLSVLLAGLGEALDEVGHICRSYRQICRGTFAAGSYRTRWRLTVREPIESKSLLNAFNGAVPSRTNADRIRLPGAASRGERACATA